MPKSRAQISNVNRFTLQVLLYVLHLRAHPLRSGDEGGPALTLEG